MSNELHRQLGEMDGKLDAILRWQEDHTKRHETIDLKIEEHAKDINQAKGAKKAIFVAASAIAGFLSLAVAAADKLLLK